MTNGNEAYASRWSPEVLAANDEPNIYIATQDDPEATVDGPGCTVRDLEAYEAAMDAALDEPEPELEAS